MARKRPNRESPTRPAQVEPSGLVEWVRPVCLFLLGLLVGWSMLQPLDSTSVFDGSALPQNLGYFLLAVGVSLDLVVHQRRNRLTRAEVGCLIGLSLWMLVVTLNAAGLSNPRTGWNGFWHLVSVLALYFSARNLLVGPKLRSMTMLILLGGASVLAGLAVYQVAIEFPSTSAAYKADPEKVIAQMGIDAPEGSAMRQRLDDRLNSPEPFATFSLANSLAVLLSGSLVLAIGSLGFSLLGLNSGDLLPGSNELARTPNRPRSANKPSLPQGLSLVPTIVTTYTILLIGIVWLLTRSRIALLSVPVSLLLMCVLAYWQYGNRLVSGLTPTTKGWMKLLLIALCLSSVAGLVWLGFKDPLVFTEATKSLSYRVDYWVATLAMIKDHTLLGIGLGNFQTIYPRYMLATASETIADPHNWILDVASTCSVPVAVVLVTGLARILIRKPTGWSPGAFDSGPSAFPLALGATLGGLVVLLSLMLFGLDMLTVIAIFIATLMAAILTYNIRTSIELFVGQSTLAPVTMAIAMLLCLLVSGSWQATGLVVPLVCCLASSRIAADDSESADVNSDWSRILWLVCSALVLIAFLWQSWSPVLRSSSAANQAAREPNRRFEHIEAARRADPYNSQWDRYLAQLLVDKALEARDASSFESAASNALQAIDNCAFREPNSFLTGQFAGDRLLQLAEMADQLGSDSVALRRRAVSFYESAVRNRPTSAQLRVQLAYGHLLVGDNAACETQIAEAQKLSENTPHQDQKLSAQLIWIPEAPAELSCQNERCRAELVVAWIRRQLNP